MKKIIIIAAALALTLTGCQKKYSPEGYEIVGGGDYYSNYPSRNYIMAIADDMVTDALEELETAFKIEEMGNSSSLRFDISAGSILTEGVSWTVIGRERALKGMTLKNIGSDTWELDYGGPYSLLGDVYPVNFIMKAKRGSLINGSHYNWGITINGNRIERGGYSCTYSSTNTVLYQCTQDNTVGWNDVEGTFTLTVLKDNQPIDIWAIEFDGVPSQAVFSAGI